MTGGLQQLRVQRNGSHDGRAMYAGPDGSWSHFQQQMAQFSFAWLM